MTRSLVIVVLLLALVVPAHAQQACGDRAEIIKMLAAKYKELPRAFGIIGDKTLVELFVSKSGSWTMMETMSQGVTCIVRSGQSWDELPPVTVYGHAT